MGTKLRALYQRSKGGDLFDLDYSTRNIEIDIDMVLRSFTTYMDFSVGRSPSAQEFLLNIEEKDNDPVFIGDMKALLSSLKSNITKKQALDWLRKELIPNI